MNWSKRALVAYENVITFDSVDHPGEQRIREAFAAEFDALWNEHRLSATQCRIDRIRQEYLADHQVGLAQTKTPADYFGTRHRERASSRQARRIEDGSILWRAAEFCRDHGGLRDPQRPSRPIAPPALWG